MTIKDIGSSLGDALYRQVGRANGRVQNYRSLPVDILENETSYRVVFDAPGAEPDDVQVRYLDGNVRIRIDRFRQFHEGHEMRFPGRGMSLSGDAELPSDAVVDPDAGTARLSETGTLSVDIPKGSSIGDADESETADGLEATDGSAAESDREQGSGTETGPVTIDD
ncbi:Hsp20/alpha crystallin family protein [Natrinema salaciae]|uniref:Molecular chaperone IbpA, HSP20 family n=1 Tax=Natrinema salaciae TaxID=1186196 RepID=A0A1H9PYD7_9EURY|nr:Hsp20/alpha crystallin family protein [Natrinema salaciae]SER53160.1 Molecular chaperone IbpA, HSP20 family [Natrinema salaciae]